MTIVTFRCYGLSHLLEINMKGILTTTTVHNEDMGNG